MIQKFLTRRKTQIQLDFEKKSYKPMSKDISRMSYNFEKYILETCEKNCSYGFLTCNRIPGSVHIPYSAPSLRERETSVHNKIIFRTDIKTRIYKEHKLNCLHYKIQ